MFIPALTSEIIEKLVGHLVDGQIPYEYKRGIIDLGSLKLKRDCFYGKGFPYFVNYGNLDQITFELSYKSDNQVPFEVNIDEVLVCLVEKIDIDAEHTEQSRNLEIEGSMNTRYNNIARQKELDGAVVTTLNRINCFIKRVHIRLETPGGVIVGIESKDVLINIDGLMLGGDQAHGVVGTLKMKDMKLYLHTIGPRCSNVSNENEMYNILKMSIVDTSNAGDFTNDIGNVSFDFRVPMNKTTILGRVLAMNICKSAYKTRKIFFIRHGQYHIGNSQLNDVGKQQAKFLGEYFRKNRDVPFDYIVSSDMDRAKSTAAIIANELSIHRIPPSDASLNEINLEDIERKGKDEDWRCNKVLKKYCNVLTQDGIHSEMLVVAHSNIISFFLEKISGSRITKCLMHTSVSCVTVDSNGSRSVDFFDNVEHLSLDPDFITTANVKKHYLV